MSIAKRRQALLAAEDEAMRRRQELQQHLEGFAEARHALLSPGRIILTGLATGFIIGKAVPALRRAEVRQDIDRGADAVQRVIDLAKSAMPLVMPLWAAYKAHMMPTEEDVQRAAAEGAAQANGQAGTVH